jgi:two-component system sensor histidine kinase UhpB
VSARRFPLLQRVVFLNGLVLVVAATLLAATPFSVSYPAKAKELVALAVGVLAMMVLDGLLVRRALAPLEDLRRSMRRIDPLRPGERLDPERTAGDLADLVRSFNEMASRLEAERRDAARRTLASREEERRGVARELHDEVGQTLTALLAQLDGVAREAPEALSPLVRDSQETARAALEDIRGVVRRLRPDTLEDLGLTSALRALSRRLSGQTGLRIAYDLDEHLPPLSEDAELVVYRIAQEALTNAIRHAEAHTVRLWLGVEDGDVALSVRDDGRGRGPRAAEHSGIRGMRERALLVGGSVQVADVAPRGTEVRLRVPILEAHR